MSCNPPGSSVRGFPRQEYWSGLPVPSPGNFPNPEIEPTSSALAVGFFTTEPPGKPHEVPGVVRFIEIESRMIVTGGWRRGDEELMGIKLQLGKMKKFQRWLHNNVNILNATELYS